MIRFFLFFLCLAVLHGFAVGLLGLEFGNVSYWSHHGVLLLAFLTFFPRLTLLLSSIPSGGILWWLSWLVAPRYLVSVLATVHYWQTNPILVTVSWLIAIGGETSEKYYVQKKVSIRETAEQGTIIDV